MIGKLETSLWSIYRCRKYDSKRIRRNRRSYWEAHNSFPLVWLPPAPLRIINYELTHTHWQEFTSVSFHEPRTKEATPSLWITSVDCRHLSKEETMYRVSCKFRSHFSVASLRSQHCTNYKQVQNSFFVTENVTTKGVMRFQKIHQIILHLVHYNVHAKRCCRRTVLWVVLWNTE